MFVTGLKMDIDAFLRKAIGLSGDDMLRIKASYESPARYYHTFRHAIMVAAEAIMCHCVEPFERPRAVLVAALYHDAVVVPGVPGNEEKSVALMRDHLAKFDHIDVDYASRLIMLTAKHFNHEPGTLDADDCKFLDCDIVGFAYPYDVFVEQNRKIDREYLDMGAPRDFLDEKRGEFLRSLLKREHIYNSPRGVMHYEVKARENIEKYLGEHYS
jgi:predicted metal-dependent HD superfamily phosphohydrolase